METGLILLAFVPTTAILWWILITLSGSAPLIDALVTALSLVAQWLLNRKHIENWLVWIVVDVLTIGLGISREMYLLATLYMIFLGMCMVGWHQWRHTMIPQSDGDHV
jgi:nicotinamide mononucleotide transporter